MEDNEKLVIIQTALDNAWLMLVACVSSVAIAIDEKAANQVRDQAHEVAAARKLLKEYCNGR